MPRATGRALVLQATPLVNSARDFFQQARALVVCQDLNDRPVPDAALLRMAFSLTPTEGSLAQGISQGLRLSDIARQLVVSSNTVRGHLKEVFRKTDTHSQSELAVLLNRLMGPDLTGLATLDGGGKIRQAQGAPGSVLLK